MHRNLAEMYVADPRFTATYDQVRDGLAQYVYTAIVANADAVDGAR
jgi:MerR family transcriptional regulator, thiopeptide resistance regulator